MNYYKRKLPHWQPEGAEYFITIRLKGSLPKAAVSRLKALRRQLVEIDEEEGERTSYIQRKIFEEYGHLLDAGDNGPMWLGRKSVAEVVEDSLHYRDSELFELYAYCIMPNHVHLVFKHLIQEEGKENPVTDIMRNFKRYTARKCNELLKRSGPFWQPESYDRVIRDKDELENTIRYTLNNPVKAGLIEYWQDWPYSYCKSEFRETFI